MAYAACADVLSFSGLNFAAKDCPDLPLNGKQNQIDLFFFADIIHIKIKALKGVYIWKIRKILIYMGVHF